LQKRFKGKDGKFVWGWFNIKTSFDHAFNTNQDSMAERPLESRFPESRVSRHFGPFHANSRVRLV
jgi:hypothetical protein